MENNYAFIDGANLHKGIESLGWHLDYGRFRIWLREKYGVTKAYLFIGFIAGKSELYLQLEEAGYVLIYKEVTYGLNGRIKGNCDADLVLRAVVDYYERNFNRAIIVSSDGDYAGLVKFLDERAAFNALLSPREPVFLSSVETEYKDCVSWYAAKQTGDSVGNQSCPTKRKSPRQGRNLVGLFSMVMD
jgi:hypothetical protein